MALSAYQPDFMINSETRGITEHLVGIYDGAWMTGAYLLIIMGLCYITINAYLLCILISN